MRLMKAQNYETYQVKKQLADLQVLDYICGNVDRHGGNMLYDVDPVTKNLKGIVGIDNDSNFGTVVKDANKKQQRLPGVNEMRVISKDMADTIINLTEGELKSTLHGYGLSQKSIDAAWERTKQLKEAVKNGKAYSENNSIVNVDSADKKPCITIMSDDDFKSVNIAYCAGKTKNYFATLDGIKNEPSTEEYENKLITQKAYSLMVGFRSAIAKEQTQGFVTKAKAAAPKWFASKRYKNFMAKLNDFHNTELKTGNPLANENKGKFDKLDELKAAVAVYKNEKIRDGFIDDKWNLKKNVTGKALDRILLVRDVEKYVNRIEKEKIVTQEMQLKHENDVKNVKEINAFLKKNKNEQIMLVEGKLKAEGVDLSKKADNVIEAKAFGENVNDNLILKKDGNRIVIEDLNDESLFSDYDEELDNNNVNNNDFEKKM